MEHTYLEGRRSQLWSAAGYIISMMYHGVFGLLLDVDGIQISPMKPKDLLFPALRIELDTGTTISKNDFESSPAWPWQERSII
jgi:hypothetical protein